MPRTLYLEGETIKKWDGVEVWQRDRGEFQNITSAWSWSKTHHQHYEVEALTNGSYWVPVSTNPPKIWGGSTPVIGSTPKGTQPVNYNNTEKRPDTTYIWIPNDSIPKNIVPGQTTNQVLCHPPNQYPPQDKSMLLTESLVTSDRTESTSPDSKKEQIMPQVRVQFFTILDGEITRKFFTAYGDAEWTMAPPVTVKYRTTQEGIAQIGDKSTVDATYYRSNGNVIFFVTILYKNNEVTALATADKEGFSATAHVSGEYPNFVVGVNFKSSSTNEVVGDPLTEQLLTSNQTKSTWLDSKFDRTENPISPKNLQEVYLSANNNFVLAQMYAEVLLEQHLDVSSIDEGLAIEINAFQKRLQSQGNFFLNKIMANFISLVADGIHFNAFLDYAFTEGRQEILHSFSNEQKQKYAVDIFSSVSDRAEEIYVDTQILRTNLLATNKFIKSFSDKYQASLEKAIAALGESAKTLSAEIDTLQEEIAQNISHIVDGANETGSAVTNLGIGILTTIKSSEKEPESKKSETIKSSEKEPESKKSETIKGSKKEPEIPSVDFAVNAIKAGSEGTGKSSQALKDLEANNEKLATAYQELASDNAILAVAKAVQVQNELFINAISDAELDAHQFVSKWGQVSSAFSDFSTSIQRISDQQQANDLASTAQGAKTLWTALFGELTFVKDSITNQDSLFDLDAA